METFACINDSTLYPDPSDEVWPPEEIKIPEYPEKSPCLEFSTDIEAKKATGGYVVKVDGAFTSFTLTAGCRCIAGVHMRRNTPFEDPLDMLEIYQAPPEAFEMYINQPDVVCIGEWRNVHDVVKKYSSTNSTFGDRRLPSYPGGCPSNLEKRIWTVDVVLHPSWWLQLHVRNARGVQLWQKNCVKGRYLCSHNNFGFERQQLRMNHACTRRLYTLTVYMCGDSNEAFLHMFNHPDWLWTHYGFVKRNDEYIQRLCPRLEGFDQINIDGEGGSCDAYLDATTSTVSSTSPYIDDFCDVYWS
jgi:hypothetical protein